MKEGTIFLVRGKKDNFKDWIFTSLVEFMSGSKYVHASIYLGGKYWEMGIHSINSNSIEEGFYEYQTRGDIYEPKITLNNDEINAGLEEIHKFKKFNTFKLINMIWIYPMRWLWKITKFVPFSRNYYISFCSEGVDKVWKKMGYDIIKGEDESYTAPFDLVSTNFFKYIGRK